MCGIKLRLVFFLIGTLFVLAPKNGLADCGWGGPFLENIEQADLIVRGKILAYHAHSLEIDILEQYKGAFENLKMLIANDPFFGASLFDFPVGTEWILALKRGRNGEYTIPGCWTSYLKVETSVVAGNLSNNVVRETLQSVSLDEFQGLLQGAEPSSWCKINNTCYWPAAFYNAIEGRLYIPAVDVRDASGKITTYKIILNQRLPSFVFDLDINSIRPHQ